MKTIKQIADELGVDKQKVYRFIVRNHVTASSEVKQTKLYDEAAESLIKSHFSYIAASNERCDLPHQKSGQEQLFQQLIKELETKNEQIKEKDRQIEQLLEQNKQLTTSLAAAQALHAGTIKQLAAAPEAAKPQQEPAAIKVKLREEAPKKKFWERFRR